MKTIIFSYEENDKPKVLEQVARRALAFGFVITKYVKVFDTKKEAQETIKKHVCKIKKAKYMTLNKKQIIKTIEQGETVRHDPQNTIKPTKTTDTHNHVVNM